MSEMLLLGAGASVDAGLPDTYGLTAMILQKVTAKPHRYGEALSFIVGGLLFAEGVAGRNPLRSGFDIEAVFRAAYKLSKWKDADLSPFVASWHPRLLELSSASHQPVSSFDQDPRDPFAAAAVGLTRLLGEVMWKATHENGYWVPLQNIMSRQPALTIATLNYDNVIENYLDSSGIRYSTLIPEMSGFNHHKGYEWEPAPVKGVLLLKLHGSLNWAKFPPNFDTTGDICPQEFVITWGKHMPDYEKRKELLPALIFGGENKLTADGPFLDIFVRFREELRRASRLTIVGYSFRDDHVNAELSAFVNQRATSHVCVIDPNPPLDTPFFRGFHGALSRSGRMSLVKKGARHGLAEIFGAVS